MSSQNHLSSLPGRAQSPVSVPRGAHPGAVLLSPKGSSANIQSMGTNPTSPSSQPLFLNDFFDQQHSLDSQMHLGEDMGRPSNMASPLATSGMNPSGSNGSTFLDSFSRPTSSMATTHHPLPLQHGSNNGNGNGNIMVNFTNDVNQLCNWISMLTPSQQNTVMDNLLSSLNEEVLHNTKLKLDSLVHSGYISPMLGPIASPVPSKVQSQVHQAEKPQPLNLDSVLNGDNLYRQWSPLPQNRSNPMQQPMYDYLSELQRPRSADPYNAFNKSSKGLASNNASNSTNNVSSTTMGTSMSTNNISNLPTSRKNMSSNHSPNQSQTQTTPQFHSSNLSQQQLQTENQNQYPNRSTSPSNNKSSTFNKSSIPLAMSSSGNALTTVNSASSTTSNSNATNNSMNAKALCDPKLLKNVPAWLKSLRLHKYSEALGGKPWFELIYLDDKALEDVGVSALGARRKLLKAFSIVREFKDNDMIDSTAF